MTVISLAAAREERQPHWAGNVYCIGCHHEWVGVGPLGTMFVDCPSCGLPKGTPKHPFMADDGDLVFACNCGCEVMTAYKRKGNLYVRCMGCGTDQTHAFYGEDA